MLERGAVGRRQDVHEHVHEASGRVSLPVVWYFSYRCTGISITGIPIRDSYRYLPHVHHFFTNKMWDFGDAC